MVLNEEIERGYYCLYRDDGGRRRVDKYLKLWKRERESEVEFT